ncbi:MAG: DUF5615 family PIN-like protein [Thiothrix litoralis]
MKLLLDENLSRRIIPAIVDVYQESSQIALLGMESAADGEIWAYARQENYLLVTQDSDFHDLSALYGHLLIILTCRVLRSTSDFRLPLRNVI